MAEVLDGFVVLEGLDGAGTTTQMELLESALTSRGRRCHTTWEPTDGPLGQEIRRALRRQKAVHPLTLAFLFAADRNEHVHEPQSGILAHLARGELVITDRYLFSSLAYQSEQCGFEYVLSLNSLFPLPRDLVFVDTPVSVCQQRLRSRGQAELFDGESMQRRVLAHYERALSLFPDSGMRLHRVDGTGTADSVCRDICEALEL
jgi:dTMP kinase